MITKDNLKFNLTIDEIEDLVAELGGEPIMNDGYFTAKTICHCGNSHKLYYYNNTHLFKCYSGCPEDTFDIFQLVMKIKKIELFPAIVFVANYFGISLDYDKDYTEKLEDWEYFNSKKEPNEKPQESVSLKVFDEKILKYYPVVHIQSWEKEGIDYNVIKSSGIKFDPLNYGIIIPHYNIDNQLVGIRERTLVKEEEIYGKYRPAILQGVQYNHPLGFNLYNLNNSKENIKASGTAIVFEGEKSTLIYKSYFSNEGDISVACCGSSLIGHQVKLLKTCGAKEIVIAFDRQFKENNDEEYQQWTKKLINIYNKYGSLVQISFIFDNDNLLGYKDSPIDKGKDIFYELYRKRIYL